MLLTQQQVQAPVLKGFKLGTRHVKDLPDNGGYQVFQKDGKIKVLTRVAWVRHQHAKKYPPNPKGTVRITESGFRAFLTPSDGVAATGGRLYGIEVGEWGGGIYFVPKDRKSFSRVSTRNTDCLDSFGNDIYAFQSLDHMMFSYADLVQVEPREGKWSTRVVKSFTEAPSVVDRDGDHFVLLMDSEVLALRPNGEQRQIYKINLKGERFWCMTILPNGQIWIGCDSGVTALVPTANGTYKPFSYIPIKA